MCVLDCAPEKWLLSQRFCVLVCAPESVLDALQSKFDPIFPQVFEKVEKGGGQVSISLPNQGVYFVREQIVLTTDCFDMSKSNQVLAPLLFGCLTKMRGLVFGWKQNFF